MALPIPTIDPIYLWITIGVLYIFGIFMTHIAVKATARGFVGGWRDKVVSVFFCIFWPATVLLLILFSIADALTWTANRLLGR